MRNWFITFSDMVKPIMMLIVMLVHGQVTINMKLANVLECDAMLCAEDRQQSVLLLPP